MRALVPSGRLSPNPGHRRPLAPPFFSEQLIGLGFWEACDAQSTATGGAVQQAGGSFRAATAIVLDADQNAGAFNYAKADVLGRRKRDQGLERGRSGETGQLGRCEVGV